MKEEINKIKKLMGKNKKNYYEIIKFNSIFRK